MQGYCTKDVLRCEPRLSSTTDLDVHMCSRQLLTAASWTQHPAARGVEATGGDSGNNSDIWKSRSVSRLALPS